LTLDSVYSVDTTVTPLAGISAAADDVSRVSVHVESGPADGVHPFRPSKSAPALRKMLSKHQAKLIGMMRSSMSDVNLLAASVSANQLNEDQQLLVTTDTLVAVGLPGNISKIDIDAGAARLHEKSWSGRSRQSCCTRCLNQETEGWFEWALRCAMASMMSSVIVLNPYTPAVLSYSVWVCVLAVVCAKPTLGDAIKTMWFPVSGGAIGTFLAYATIGVLYSCGVLGWVWPHLIAMVVIFFCLAYTFGDNIQCRWALLPILIGVVQPTYAAYVTGLCSSDPTASCSSAEYLQFQYGTNGRGQAFQDAVLAKVLLEVVETYLGFVVGGLCGCTALILPFPRTAAPQLQRRIELAYRQIAQLHSVLTVALLQTRVPHVLNEKMEEQLARLDQTIASINMLAEDASWEPTMWRCCSSRCLDYEWHMSMVHVLKRNLTMRYHSRRVNREASGQITRHALLARRLSSDGEVDPLAYFMGVHTAARALREVAVTVTDPSHNHDLDQYEAIIEMLDQTNRQVKIEVERCIGAADADQDAENEPGDTKAPYIDERLSIPLHESIWLTIAFNAKVGARVM
jgi:hypothetical protein